MKTPKDRSTYPELLTGGESRQLIGFTAAVWMELLETEQLPKPVRVSGRLKWRKGELLAWVKQLRHVELCG